MGDFKHLSVHQWIRSAIPDSQQPTSPIGFLFLKLPPPPCAVLLVFFTQTHSFQRSPPFFRFPRRWSTNVTLTLLAFLGLEPLHDPQMHLLLRCQRTHRSLLLLRLLPLWRHHRRHRRIPRPTWGCTQLHRERNPGLHFQLRDIIILFLLIMADSIKGWYIRFASRFLPIPTTLKNFRSWRSRRPATHGPETPNTFSRERLRRVLRKKAAVILHLHTLTSADLHLHTLTSADLHLHTLTSHLHTC